MKTHIPVLPTETLNALAPQVGQTYIDTTAGLGGHAGLVLTEIGETGQAWLIDQDETAIAELTQTFEGQDNVHILQSNFADVDWSALPLADMILMDLGVSSMQLDTPDRGFSFQTDGPLDMRMDQSTERSAYHLVNESREDNLADIIYRYGEEHRSRKIARAIVAARPLQTTQELRQVIHDAIGNGGRTDSATLTFQGIRIAVNEELQALEDALPKAAAQLKPGGRLVVISFHSLEDRIVKNYFRTITTPEVSPITGQPISSVSFKSVTKKPQIAATTEIESNPRARSAKLRAVEKQN